MTHALDHELMERLRGVVGLHALQRWPVRDTSYHGVLQDIYLDNELDLYEPDMNVHHRVLDFEVVYTEIPA